MLLVLKEFHLGKRKIIPIDYIKKGRGKKKAVCWFEKIRRKKSSTFLLGYLIHYGLEKFYSSTHFQLMCN